MGRDTTIVNRVVAIITARGGSKGILRKNLRELAGKPLIQYTFDAAQSSTLIDEIVLSTDDEEIANFAIERGISVPFMRPKDLASDEASSRDVLTHALQQIPKYDHFILLQPTSPLRTSRHVDEALGMYLENNLNSLVSVSQVTEHPDWMYERNSDGFLITLNETPVVARRQDLRRIYLPNGAIYIREINDFWSSSKILGDHSFGFVMSEDSSIDIDTEIDLVKAEWFLNRNTTPKIED